MLFPFFPILGGRDQSDQSSPVHPVSESRGGSTSVTDEQTDRRTKEILVSNLGLGY